MNMARKVDLFVVGAMKAGTTSFVSWLSENPEIYVPPIKEPNFFVDKMPVELYTPSRFFDLDQYFKKRFPEDLHIADLQTAQQYEKAYSMVQQQPHMLDASTAYLHAPESADLIHAYNPDAKIIILLRDPLKRAYSHYKMNCGLNRELRTFQEAIAQDIQAFDEGVLDWHSYLGMSLYQERIDLFKSKFKDVLILFFEDFVNDTAACASQIEGFLSLPVTLNKEVAKSNISRVPKNPRLLAMLQKWGVKDIFSALVGPTIKQRIYRRISTKPEGIPQLDTPLQNRWDELTQYTT